jgi:hypothetical protein
LYSDGHSTGGFRAVAELVAIVRSDVLELRRAIGGLGPLAVLAERDRANDRVELVAWM